MTSPTAGGDNLLRGGALGNGAVLVAHYDSAQTRAVLPTILREWGPPACA